MSVLALLARLSQPRDADLTLSLAAIILKRGNGWNGPPFHLSNLQPKNETP